MNITPNINKQTYSLINNKRENNVQFKGLNLRKLMPKSNKAKEEFFDITSQYGLILGQDSKKILNVVKNANQSKLQFFDELVAKYNSRNFYLSNNLREDSQHVLDIFSAVQKPTKTHFNIISNQHCPMKTMNKIFKGINNDSKKAEMVKEALDGLVTHTQNDKNINYNLITDLLESPHVEKYTKDFKTYQPYIILNKENPSVVKELDKLVTNETYNANTVKKELAIKNLFSKSYIEPTTILNPATVKENYSSEGKKFINMLYENFGFSKGGLKAGNDKEILEMYKSTTKENFNLRQNIVEGYYDKRFHNINSQEYNPEIKEMQNLFNKVEQDKNIANFVEKLMKDKAQPQTIKELNTIIDNIPSRKLNVFYSNTKNIIRQTSGEKTVQVLKTDIENPFYESENTKFLREDGLRNKFVFGDNIFKKTSKFITNQVNKLIYKLTPDNQSVKSVKEPIVKQFVKETIIPEAKIHNNIPVLPEHIEKLNKQKDIMKEVLIEKVTPMLESQKTTPSVNASPFSDLKIYVKDTSKFEVKPAFPVLKQAPSKASNAKKLQIINDVNNIINKKLGAKTLEQQKRDYAIKATKIRMSLLPEIFESIKDTRKIDKLVGKTKIMSSNKDALELYEKINGKNKKLVNYMLKKRNVDGTRLYEVKDIINVLDKAEGRITKLKQANPEFKAQDAKAYYDKLLDAQIQQNGKLPRTMKKS